MALEPELSDYAVVNPGSGDARGTKPFLALMIGGTPVRQFTAANDVAGALFEKALKRAQEALEWEGKPGKGTSPPKSAAAVTDG